jgi:hypothetical protein
MIPTLLVLSLCMFFASVIMFFFSPTSSTSVIFETKRLTTWKLGWGLNIYWATVFTNVTTLRLFPVI